MGHLVSRASETQKMAIFVVFVTLSGSTGSQLFFYLVLSRH